MVHSSGVTALSGMKLTKRLFGCRLGARSLRQLRPDLIIPA
jgi:hypothetical protein